MNREGILSDSDRRSILEDVRRVEANRESRLADYRRDAAAARRDGERPRYCVHGTFLMTEYDPMCPECEDYGFNGFPSHAENLAEAAALIRARWTECYKGLDYLAPLRELVGREQLDEIDFGLVSSAVFDRVLEKCPTFAGKYLGSGR